MIHYTGSLGLSPLGWVQPGQVDLPPQIWTLYASNIFSTSGALTKNRELVASATNTFTCSTDPHQNRDFLASASSAFTGSSSADVSTNRVHNVSASNSFTGSSDSSENREAVSSASNSFTASSLTSFTRDVVASASNAFTVSSVSILVLNNDHFLVAGNFFSFSGIATEYKPSPKYVSASSHIYFWPHAESRSNKIIVSASSSFTVSADASEYKTGSVFVNASNSFNTISSASKNAIIKRSASNAFMMSCSSSENRDIHCIAYNVFGAATSPRTTNLKSVAASNHVTFVSIATLTIGNPTGVNSFGIQGFATATTKLPWRRHALTRPPGGGIPHS